MTTHLREHGERNRRAQSWQVNGRVIRANGSPVAGAKVRVRRQGIRTTGEIANKDTASTTEDGRFELEYQPPDTHLDLRVELLADPDLGIGTTRPRLISGPGQEERVDFVVNDEPFIGPSEFERLVETLEPVLAGEEIELAELLELEEVERALLATKTGVHPAEIVLLTQSIALGDQTGIPAQVFYGMGKQKVPLALPAVLAIGPGRRRAAVEAALGDNQIPATLTEAIDDAMAKLDQLAIGRAMDDTGRIGGLLALADVPRDARDTLVEDYLAAGDEPNAFWQRVRDRGELDPEQIDRAQLALQLGVVTQNHPPLAKILLERGVERLAEVAGLDVGQWRELAGEVGVPADLAAAGMSEDDYAAMVFTVVEDAFPTEMVAHRVDEFVDSKLLSAFLGANSAFDLRQPFMAYLREHPDALDHAGENGPKVEKLVKGVQRVYRIAPRGARVETTQRLLADGLDSADKIRSLGKAAFVRRYRDTLGDERAAAVWSKASHASALAITLLARHSAMFDHTPIASLPIRLEGLSELPEYESLFGGVDFCACEHCQSLYSPAAYLVDVLHWLGNRSALGADSALDVLFSERRADIGTIELSCKNTNIELPYIDLVNEVLELAVAPPDEPPRYQTGGNAADLRAQPEHLHEEAYVVLAGATAGDGEDAVHPFHLPFHLWLLEARTYLGQLGLARDALMEAFLGREAAQPDAGVAAEVLRMSPLEWDIIAGNALEPPRSLEALWGREGDPSWIESLAQVRAFCDAARRVDGTPMRFDELTDVLRAAYVQGAGPLGIWFASASCDTATAELVGLGVSHLERIHRFVRLQRRLGWSAADLDRAIRILGSGNLDEATLLCISHVARLSAALGLAIDELLGWWGHIDTRRWSGRLRRGVPAGAPSSPEGFGMVFDEELTPQPAEGGDRSDYDRLFQHASTAVNSAFGVAASGDALVDESLPLDNHTTAIAAALGITAADLELLWPRLPDRQLSLANLSRLYRHVSAARALGLTIRELMAYLAVTGIDPFDAASPASARLLGDEVRANRASNVPIAELDYLLRHVEPAPGSLAPRATAVGALLLGIQDALRTPESAEAAVIDALGAAVGLDARTTSLLSTQHLALNGTMLIEVFTADEVRDYSETEGGTNAPRLPTATELPDQFSAYELLHKVALILRRFEIAAAELPWVMEIGPARGTLDLRTLPLEASPVGIAYQGWSRLRDAAALRRRSATTDLLDLFERAHQVDADGDPQAIAAAHADFLAALETRMSWGRPDLEILIGSPATPGVLGLSYPAHFADERGLQRVAEVLSVVARVGLSAAVLSSWSDIPLASDGSSAAQRAAIAAQSEQAREIVQAVRARYESRAWLEVATTLRDRLRAQQRDALVSWLIGHDERFSDPTSLFDHFLLDVEMSPCQLTSRIKQAISSVQLFVQRVLLGREVDSNGDSRVELSADELREWKWMKGYRVWEANRKVFLYPENWIEPELRDDKTPFFEELEAELLGGEISHQTAERALIGYLEKLHDVARLEIVGITREQRPRGEVLHLVGRTRGTPARHYYRRRVETGRWTPWEAGLSDIDADQLLLVAKDGRLYLFWPEITEVANEEVPDTPSEGGHRVQSKPTRYYQIRLAWSERRAGSWSSKRVSREQIGATEKERRRLQRGLVVTEESARSDLFLGSYEEDGDLIVAPVRRRRIETRVHTSDGRVVTEMRTRYFGLDRFRMSVCDGTMSLEPQPLYAAVRPPVRTAVVNQTFARKRAGGGLAVPVVDPITNLPGQQPMLSTTLTPFAVVPIGITEFGRGRRTPPLFTERPFVFQDQQSTFLVQPQVSPGGRRASAYAVADAISLEVDRLIAEVSPRPPMPVSDPWSRDPAMQIRSPDLVELDDTSRLVRTSDDGASLASAGAYRLGETLDARVASVGSEIVEARANRLALESSATIAGETGENLISVRSAQPPAEVAGLRTLTLKSFFDAPALAMDVVDSGSVISVSSAKLFRFDGLYHPWVCALLEQLLRHGADGVLDPGGTGTLPARQQLAEEFFEATYGPLAVAQPYPVRRFDFSPRSAYGIYNWELFFHLPFLVATQLTRNQRFEEAQRWFHYIFDPTAAGGISAPQRFWKVRPLFELFYGERAEAGSVFELLLLLHYRGDDPKKVEAREDIARQVAEWRQHPFEPHALARLRPTTYQKAVVMRYVDNLIEWGDQLFRRDTLESINEATQLYLLAAAILGRRPQRVPTESPEPRTFDDLRAAGIDTFGNALLEEIEGFLPDIPEDDFGSQADELPVGATLYFCIPPNQKVLSEYWDRVADRLFKIRNCMSIEGTVRELPLFEPPIDPELLVRARAAGVDLGSALAELDVPAPRHRYTVLVQRAKELCGDVRALGQSLLGALERRDAEELALLRAGHERDLFEAMREVRNRQIEESRETLESLRRSRENAELRMRYYRSRTLMNTAEKAELVLMVSAGVLDTSAGSASLGGVIGSSSPNYSAGTAGFGGSPYVVAEIGGGQAANAASLLTGYMRIAAGVLDRAGQLAGLMGSYLRRKDDWDLQGDVAEKEIQALEKQILAAEIRVAIAERERANLELQLAQAEETEAYLRDKFSSAELYSWMVGQLSGLYFQSYQLAYEMAKRAEKAWQRELADPAHQFIGLAYWDSLKKGLLAGERLYLDLQRMESARLDADVREYELTRHVSLRELDPLALLELRQSGECFIRVPEAWFDLDSPGHYLRRIKTVSVSIPSVTGPYAPVRCTLTLLHSSTRVSPDTAPGYERTGLEDDRFRDDTTSVESIVTSHAVEDPGLFETNLRDERYLPFEGAGAISEWRLELPKELRQFDYDTISDVVLHVRYTARPGGGQLRQAAEAQLREALRELVLGSNEGGPAGDREGLLHLLSARRQLPDAWTRFMAPPEDQPDQVLELDVPAASLPFALQSKTVEVLGVDLFLLLSDSTGYDTGAPVKLQVSTPSSSEAAVELPSSTEAFSRLPRGRLSFGASPAQTGAWTIAFREADNAAVSSAVVIDTEGHRRLDADNVLDLIAIFRYRIPPV